VATEDQFRKGTLGQTDQVRGPAEELTEPSRPADVPGYASWDPVASQWFWDIDTGGISRRHTRKYLAGDTPPTPRVSVHGKRPEVVARQLQDAIREVMIYLGLDVHEENFRDTPRRVAKALASFRQGEAAIEEAMGADFSFNNGGHSMVALSSIDVAALCPHHFMPWYGSADIGYIPSDKVLGLSKLPRLVHAVSHAIPQMQEVVTDKIANLIEDRLKPKGTIVQIHATHTCMACRGVEAPRVMTHTSAIRGNFVHVPAARQEFMTLIAHQRRG
jgi:GTP cyclohydrolase I